LNALTPTVLHSPHPRVNLRCGKLGVCRGVGAVTVVVVVFAVAVGVITALAIVLIVVVVVGFIIVVVGRFVEEGFDGGGRGLLVRGLWGGALLYLQRGKRRGVWAPLTPTSTRMS
jgi:hypothetical protein